MNNDQLTAEFANMIEQTKGGRPVSITLENGMLNSGMTFTRIEYPRYGGNGRSLKPERALSAVIIGPHAETLRTLADALESE